MSELRTSDTGVGQGANETKAATEPVSRPDSLPSKDVLAIKLRNIAQHLRDGLEASAAIGDLELIAAEVDGTAPETCDVERLRLERNVLQIDLERAQRIAALHTAEPFVVRHYTGDERPCIKGNGFDGLLVGEDREEAQAFVDWLNDRLRQETKAPAQKAGEPSV